MPWLYLRGISTGNMKDALSVLLGDEQGTYLRLLSEYNDYANQALLGDDCKNGKFE